MKRDKRRKQKNPISIAVNVLLALLVLAVILTGLADDRIPVITINGEKNVVLEYGSGYVDAGCTADSEGYLFGILGWPFGVEASGYVNTTVLGDYQIKYTTGFLGRTAEAIRNIKVVDSTAPVITLNTVNGYEPTWMEGYTEEGYSAYDAKDGDVTENVARESNGASISYTVTDSEGNRASQTRIINYKLGRPNISLIGDSEITIEEGTPYTDPGFTAFDSKGNDVSQWVSVANGVQLQAGDYEVVYSAYNNVGDSVVVTRTVHVKEPEKKVYFSEGDKVIYLTFDDGPGAYTNQLLDVLAKYNVKATFFVTGINSEYADCIGRAYREGHSIGVHSMTHNYYSIYASEDAFLNDFWSVQELIKQQTGKYTTLFRFPGGSSNTVSSFNPGIMTRLSKLMQDNGYHYFDWNVLSGDAGETTNTNQVYRNVINGCSQNKINVVLQHDIKNFSVAAVEDIIIWGLNNGYKFAPLDTDSFTAHHDLNN